MNVYVESNFVLETAFMQEQQESCVNILRLCETGELRVIVPAYCIAEPYETMIRRSRDRDALQKRFAEEVTQLLRSEPYKEENDVLRQVTRFLVDSIDDESRRLDVTVARLLKVVETIPLTAEILTAAQDIRSARSLSPQDAVVYASVIQHLALSSSTDSCFLNRNSKDFSNPDIKDELGKYNCKLLTNFDVGYTYIQSQLKSL